VPGRVAAALAAHAECGIATAAAPISSLAEFLDPSCVKVVCGLGGDALYFSRACVPWPREAATAGRPSDFSRALRHIGVYGYRVKSLLEFAGWPPTPLEATEKLEQLRALEHGMRIHVVALQEAPPAGVDTPEDLERVRARLHAG
jgi:3-deoxy-manno-octulosonate cytidylyltransferase (CMP-KDO synthetase)